MQNSESKMETRSRRSVSSRQSENQPEVMTVASDKGSIVSVPSEVLPSGQAVITRKDLLQTDGGNMPLKTRGLEQLKQKIEEELGKQSIFIADTPSPGLTRLRNTPGRGLKEKQKQLINKHEQIRQNSDKLNVGGGVTLWPNMNQMRLSKREIIVLCLICIFLMALTGLLFLQLHGDTYHTMSKFRVLLTNFGASYPIKGTGNIKSSILIWHSNFRNLLDGVDKLLNVTRPSAGYQLYILAYVAALGVLVYFLVDNMFSSSKLSPGRIKKWVCLLVVMAQWTLMLFVMFMSAHKLEASIIDNVHQISEKMGEFLEHDLDVSTLDAVVQYWRRRCLPPAAPGVIHVLGMVAVQDLAVYLQYYSLPVITVLLTPVVRLCLAVHTVYTSTG